MLPLYSVTGVGSNELRFAYIDDLDLENGTLFVQTPRGGDVGGAL